LFAADFWAVLLPWWKKEGFCLPQLICCHLVTISGSPLLSQWKLWQDSWFGSSFSNSCQTNSFSHIIAKILPLNPKGLYCTFQCHWLEEASSSYKFWRTVCACVSFWCTFLVALSH
jgi:hypothetical protein